MKKTYKETEEKEMKMNTIKVTSAAEYEQATKKMIKVEIYWQDLTEQKQAELLELFGDNGNWDVIPMCTLEIEEEGQDE